MSTGPHVDDIGTVFQITFVEDGQAVNIEGCSSKTIRFRKPSGETVEKTAAYATNGSDGKIKYTTIAGDLDEEGVWHIQGFVILPSGQWHSMIASQRIFPNIEITA